MNWTCPSSKGRPLQITITVPLGGSFDANKILKNVKMGRTRKPHPPSLISHIDKIKNAS